MTFTNPLFFLMYLPSVLIGFEFAGCFGRRTAIAFLSLASLLFYAKWSVKYLFLLIASIFVNFLFSLAIEKLADRQRTQNVALAAGIGTNLAVLCYYKYLFPVLHFFTGMGILNHQFGSAILPLGISFFTFTQIAYLIDLKQGIAKREPLINYSLFVTFFPHLIAGPIVHHEEMMPQFSAERRYRLDSDDMAVGLTWFTMGFFKKVMIADLIAPQADAFFTRPHNVGASEAWIGLLTYSLQLYFDFSGYSDMAVGLARMFSIRFPLNFNSPYKAKNIIDFWQRWHITLTRYIMSYVYSPVLLWVNRRRLQAGKKVSRKATRTVEGFLSMVTLPTMFALFLAGVWHGAGFQFLVFGLMHGVFLVINHAWRTFLPEEGRARKLLVTPLGIALTYTCVLSAQVMFRASSFQDAVSIYGDLLGLHGAGAAWSLAEVGLFAGLYSVIWLMPNTQEIIGEAREDEQPNWSIFRSVRWQPTWPWWIATTAVFAASMFYSSANSTFLYFQF